MVFTIQVSCKPQWTLIQLDFFLFVSFQLGHVITSLQLLQKFHFQLLNRRREFRLTTLWSHFPFSFNFKLGHIAAGPKYMTLKIFTVMSTLRLYTPWYNFSVPQFPTSFHWKRLTAYLFHYPFSLHLKSGHTISELNVNTLKKLASKSLSPLVPHLYHIHRCL